MSLSPHWRDQLNTHADELHQLHAATEAHHADQAAKVAESVGPAMMTLGEDPQRPADTQETP